MRIPAGPHAIAPLLAISACLASAPLAGQDQLPAPQPGPRPLRAMTYNIHHGTGHSDCQQAPGQPECGFDLQKIIDVIRTEAPDIVALQEVDRFWRRSWHTDQPALLAAALGMNQCYGANLSHNPDSHADVPHQYGTLILSRYDILRCRNTFLPSTRPATDTSPAVRREQRGLLEALVNVEGVPLRFYNTHLEHTSAYADVRTAQINAAIELIGDFEEDSILAGDLNAVPTAPEMQPLFAIFRDAWVIANPGDPGFTIEAAPDVEPTRRIDYLLLSPDVAVEGGGPDGAAVVRSDLTEVASDHYPVRANLSLPGAHVGIGR